MCYGRLARSAALCASLRLLPRGRSQWLAIILELQYFLDKSWQIIVNLQKRIEIACITNVFEATGHAFLALSLLRVQRLVRARIHVLSLFLH